MVFTSPHQDNDENDDKTQPSTHDIDNFLSRLSREEETQSSSPPTTTTNNSTLNNNHSSTSTSTIIIPPQQQQQLNISSIIDGIKNLLVELFEKATVEEIDHAIAKSKFDARGAYRLLLEKYPPPPPPVPTFIAVQQPSVSDQIISQQYFPIGQQPGLVQQQHQQQQQQHVIPFGNQNLDPMMCSQMSFQMPYSNNIQFSQQPIFPNQMLNSTTNSTAASTQNNNSGMGQGLYYIAVDSSQMSNSIINADSRSPSSSTLPTNHHSQTNSIPPTVTNQTFTTIDKKKKCKDWDKCTHTSDQTHVEKFFHPCRNGVNCKNIGNVIHQNRFIHPCKEGKQCKKKDESHLLMFTHK